MFGKKETFRRAALERLSSPERLDEMMRAIPPKGWVAITTIVGLGTLALLWGFFGSVPNRVEGQGLLIPGRTRAVYAPKPGVLTKIFVKSGDTVNPGDQVAVLTDPNAAHELQSLQRELENLEADNRKALQEDDLARVQGETTYRMNERTFQSQIAIQERLRDDVARRLDTMEQRPDLYPEGQKAPLRARKRDAENQISTLQAQIESNRKQQREEENSRSTESRRRQQKIDAKKSEIALKQLAQGQVLKATHAGRVFDVLIDEGSTATPQQMIVRIEELDQELQAVVYVPAREGQDVKVDDEVQIAPSNVKKEEYGTIRARVADKNEYPSDKQAIINEIRNETLAAEYTKNGAPLYVRIELDRLKDAEQSLAENPALSGYQWTSGKGPERKIFSGTPCQATVITGYGRPIDRAISWLKTTTGL
jgi:HlyD family secretion protein